MFFFLSKVLWWVAAPANLLFILLIAGVVLLWTRHRRAGRVLVSLVLLAILGVTTLPLVPWAAQTLEDRFPRVTALPAKVAGIVVLGGVITPWVSVERGTLALGEPVERLIEFAGLAKRYPEVPLIFTGGTGSLSRQDLKEADLVRSFWDQIGLSPERIQYENQSRNTYENAVMSFPLAQPTSAETWVLVTSAIHMPRAVGSFRQAGWSVLPYPVDFRTGTDRELGLSFNIGGRLSGLNGVAHEWAGLLFYWLTGRTDALFPGPAD